MLRSAAVYGLCIAMLFSAYIVQRTAVDCYTNTVSRCSCSLTRSCTRCCTIFIFLLHFSYEVFTHKMENMPKAYTLGKCRHCWR
jgi:hypothetical protein